MEIGLLVLRIFKAPVDMFDLEIEHILSGQFKKYNTGSTHFTGANMTQFYFRNIPSYLIEEIPQHLNSVCDYKIEIVPDYEDYKNDEDFKDISSGEEESD